MKVVMTFLTLVGILAVSHFTSDKHDLIGQDGYAQGYSKMHTIRVEGYYNQRYAPHFMHAPSQTKTTQKAGDDLNLKFNHELDKVITELNAKSPFVTTDHQQLYVEQKTERSHCVEMTMPVN